MRTDPSHHVVRETEAALAGIEASLSGDSSSAELLLTPLARIGDALRLRLDVPAATRRWSERLSGTEIAGALHCLAAEASGWIIPAAGVFAAAEDDPFLATVLQRRDEAASVVLAARRIAIVREPSSDELDALQLLTDALERVDGELGALMTRAEVATMLGARVAFDPIWADAFCGRDTEADVVSGADSEGLPWSDAMGQFPPSDEVVTNYVTGGTLARYVEGFAARQPAFAQVLAACIDDLVAVRAAGFVARRWRARRGQSAPGPLRLPAVPALRLAAATEPDSEPRGESIRLGALSPIDAEGRLVVTAREVSLLVYPENATAVARVELGGGVATEPSSPERWVVTIPLSQGPVRLRVVGPGGAEFVEDIVLEPLDDRD